MRDSVGALRSIEVRTAAAADAVPRVAAVLADAFIDDPVFTWLLPGRLRQEARLRAMFAAEMEQYVLPSGTVWTTSGYDGAVTELPPGAWEMPSSATLKEALKWLRAFGMRLPLATRVQHAMEERHLREPHFYVRTIGVRTALQGQGVGSALMQPTFQRADSAGLPTYLEASSERSAALYERLGFMHMDVLELPEGGPPLWRMRRPPAGSPVGA
jgi:GNAT superfamily N-acetyltransferase